MMKSAELGTKKSSATQTKNLIFGAFFLVIGMITLLFKKNNYKPIYRGIRYFMEHESYQQSLAILKADPKTAELIETRYQEFYPVPWNELKILPPGTLGYEFYQFMNKPEVTPIEELPEAKVEINPEIDYLRRRIRFTHDIHHLMTGHPSTELGEMGISAFYVAQIRSPLNAILLAVGLIKCTLKYPKQLSELLEAMVEGYEMGKKADFIFGLKWENDWSVPIHILRQQYKITPSRMDFITQEFPPMPLGLRLNRDFLNNAEEKRTIS